MKMLQINDKIQMPKTQSGTPKDPPLVGHWVKPVSGLFGHWSLGFDLTLGFWPLAFVGCGPRTAVGNEILFSKHFLGCLSVSVQGFFTETDKDDLGEGFVRRQELLGFF
jgi:hypothetical protein